MKVFRIIVSCGRRFQKTERTHPVDMSKNGCKFIFEQKSVKFFVNQPCYMAMYRAYQTNLTAKKLMNVSEKVNIAVQTDPG